MFAGLSIVGTGAAAGQTVLHSPQAIAACLCLDDGVGQARTEMQRARDAYEAARARVEQLTQQTVQERARVNSDDPVSVDSYKDLLARRDAAERDFANKATPTYAAAIARYNDAVGSYNARCEGKSFDADILASVRQSLVCPR